MEAFNTWLNLSALLVWLIKVREIGGQCSLPTFLWQAVPEDTRRVWISEARYKDNSEVWESRHEMSVSQHSIVTRIKYPAPCADYEEYGSTPCYKEELLHSRTCIKAKDDFKFILRQGDSGFEKYTCLKVLQRGKSIIQVWSASKLKTTLDLSICDDDNLIRIDWPWIALTRQEWVPCPLNGGYNFDAFLNDRKRRLCSRIWRPSRLESECVVGDGVTFLFPEKPCSPFYNKAKEKSFECWTFWTEEQFLFMFLAEKDKQARYVMRVPRHFDGVDVMTAKFYFSAVTPLIERGMPPANIRHLELRLTRSESGVCFDESREECEQLAKERKCTNGGLHEFGNHCKKSCGLCKLAPSLSPECHFPTEYQGEWLLYEDTFRQEVRINGGYLSISRVGTFICKGKHWEESNFKLLSVYDNGCRPRFTCINFVYQDSGNILRFRLSKSDRGDKSFDLCDFQDDPPPIGNMYRSEELKTMFSVARLESENCGLGGLVEVNAIFLDGRSCHATLSDWNPFSCSVTSKMALSLRSCKNTDSREHQEFYCESLLTLPELNYRLLVTRQEVETGDHYACWIIRMNAHKSTKEPWRRVGILQRAQCGSPDDLDPAIYKPYEVIFNINHKPLEKDCIVMNKGATSHASTIRYTVRKGANTKGTSSKTRKQHTTTAHTQAVSQGRAADSARRQPSSVLVTLLLTALVILYQT